MERLERAGVGRLGAFTTLTNFEFNLLVVLQRLIWRVDVRPMDEEILTTAVRTDEPKPLLRIEKLYCTCSHVTSPVSASQWMGSTRFPLVKVCMMNRLAREVFKTASIFCLKRIAHYKR